MKKIIKIEGMSCAHCQAASETALNAIPGVSAKVDLKKKQAVVTYSGDIADETFTTAIEEAGFKVTSITEKKGLFA